MSQSDKCITNFEWGKDIEFANIETKQIIEEHLVPLLNKILDFLRNESNVDIKNKEASAVQQKVFSEKSYNKQQYYDFFMRNIEGISKEMSEELPYEDDEKYAQQIGKKWLAIKQYMYFNGFFMVCCTDAGQSYQLFENAFKNYVMPTFFQMHRKNLLTCVCNLINKERQNNTEHNQNIEHLIQMFLVCGMNELIIKKSAEKNLLDPLIYIPAQDEVQTANQFYINNFEKDFTKHLQQLYNEYQTKWQQSNNTNQYVSDAINQLEKEDKLLQRYCSFSKRSILNAIEDIVIVQQAKNLVYQEGSSFLKMIVNKKYDDLKQIYQLFKRVSRDYINQKNKEYEEFNLKKEQEKKKAEKRARKLLKKQQKIQDEQYEQQMDIQGQQQNKQDQQQISEKNNDKLKQEQEETKDQTNKIQNTDQNEEQEPQLKIYPIQYLKDVFYQHIKEQGDLINKNQEVNEKAILYFQKVNELKDESDYILNECFQKDLDLQKALDQAFRDFLNKFDNSASFLAQFCDNLLHKDSSKGMSEQDVDQSIKKIESYVYFIYQKDVFFSLYEKYLANRLLGNKVTDSENEQKVISSFKKEHGAQSMKNCSKMILEIETAEEENRNFQKYVQENSLEISLKQNFRALVLQKSCWPLDDILEENRNINIPQQLLMHVNAFEKYYKKTYATKLVSWLYKEGEGNIQMLSGNRCTFTGTTYHIVFLLAFNQKDEWKVKEIKDFLNFPSQKVSQFVKQFLKYKLISLDPPLNGKESKITGDHLIKLNVNFKPEKKRIVLNIVRKVEDRQVKKIPVSAIDLNRGYIIEGNIVKVMKAKRQLNFPELQSEVIKITKLFTPEMKMIKQKIEGLIEKDYLYRDKENPAVLIYKP